MRITALVENTSICDFKPKHGLSLYIETEKHKLLFDLGPDKTLFENAKNREIDLTAVDTVIISHGHIDHGGALRRFLEINDHAAVYIQRSAFEMHYSKVLGLKISVGLDKKLMSNDQIKLLDGDHVIDDELSLFAVSDTVKCHSPMNDVLYAGKVRDDFRHEQNLFINGDRSAVVMGCGHSGVVNILEKAPIKPSVCVGGFHLFDPITKRTAPTELLDEIATELKEYPNTTLYTCHCTGQKAFAYLKNKTPNIYPLYCGGEIEL